VFLDFDLKDLGTDIQGVDLHSDSLRIGGQYSPTTHSRFIAVSTYIDETQEQHFESFSFNTKRRGHTTEVQYLFNGTDFNAIVGSGYSNLEQNEDGERQQRINRSAYLYSYVHPNDYLHFTLGFAYSALSGGGLYKDQFAPKLGAILEVTPKTTLRLAYLQTLRRAFPNDQTIEPTQVAGFNQIFDDITATSSTRYGIALDQKLSNTAFAGIELSRRELSIPVINITPAKQAETLFRAYAHYAFSQRIALSADYQLEYFDNFDRDVLGTPDTKTHFFSANARYFHPLGMIGRLGFIYVHQDVNSAVRSGTDGFPLVDLALGYRLSKRYGLIQFVVRNLLDQEFSYQDDNQRTNQIGSAAPFLPERTFSTQITLAF
jgi:hypothetical protein